MKSAVKVLTALAVLHVVNGQVTTVPYRYVSSPQTYNQAVAYCEAAIQNGVRTAAEGPMHLVDIKTALENLQVYNFVISDIENGGNVNPLAVDIWIGYDDQDRDFDGNNINDDSEGQFFWVSGVETVYEAFADNEPNQTPTQMNVSLREGLPPPRILMKHGQVMINFCGCMMADI